MSDPLATYLHDHLAGSNFAIELLDSLLEQYRDQPLAAFAQGLKNDVAEDRETLEGIIERVGKTRLDLKETLGWLAEKAGQVKLRRDDSCGGIGTFEALEALTLGIRGKLALWQVLPVVREVDPRIPNNDFASLAARAEDQYARAEAQRLELARTTFGLVHK